MKKKTIRWIAILAVIVLLLPIAVNVAAKQGRSSSSSSSSSMIPSLSEIIFYNKKNPETSLRVKKTVTTTAGAQAPEDDAFEFTLELNGAPAAGLVYTLYDADNNRIYNYESGQTLTPQAGQFEVALKTDRDGVFTLLAGQTAKFDGLAPGSSYQVSEDVYDPYSVVSPAAGSSKGTLTNEGVLEEFKNMYGEGAPRTLTVRKNVSYPAGYEVPETPDFTFSVEFSGKPYAEKAYTIKNVAGDATVGTGTTDAEGKFTLQGNTYAVFDKVPADEDYTVKELLAGSAAEAAGWRIVSEEELSGATKDAGTVLNFSNVLASFAVTKSMATGLNTDEPFAFQVLNGVGKAYGESLSYYLYDNAKNLVDEELHVTGTDGSFVMKAGQTAVFVGVPKDTEFGVRETSSGRYVQTIPSAAGYSGKVVGDAVEILPFVNTEMPQDRLLTVKKIVVDDSEEGNAPAAEFRFRILRKTGEDTYEPVAKAAYDIIDVNGTRTLSADENGEFTLVGFETARFVELKDGETYRVEEITDSMPKYFALAGDAAHEATFTEELDTINFEFKNSYKGPVDPVASIRKERGTTEQLLPGAVLRLIEKNEDGTETVIHEWRSEAGAESFQVAPGTYYIREMEAPEGFEVAEDVKIVVEAVDADKIDEVEPQTFKMIDHRDTNVPTGVAEMRKPIVRTLIGLGIVLAAAAAAWFGLVRKKKKA